MAVGRLVNLLRGSVALEVSGAFPERFLNLCAQRGVAFWGVEQPDPATLYLTVAWRDRPGLDELAERTGCSITEGKRAGLPHFARRFRRRYALIIGFLLAALAVTALSRVVLVVEVEGNADVPTAIILSELSRQGLRPGVYGPGLNVREVCNNALLRLEDLSWMTVNLHGIRAQVVVRERLKTPEKVDETVFGDIVAEAGGIVTHIEAWSGDPAVKEGDTVLPGETLIRGSIRMDPPQYSENPPEWMPVRAMGRVEGRTWRTLTAAIPLEAQVKAWTGERRTVWSLSILGRRVIFFGNSGISTPGYDKISKTWAPMPSLSIQRETLRGYELSPCPIDTAADRAMLESQLLARLAGLLGESGEMTDHRFFAEEGGGLLRVTLTAECKEELGRFVPADT